MNKLFFKLKCSDIDEYEKPYYFTKYFECDSFSDIDKIILRKQLNVVSVKRINIEQIKP